MNQDKLRENLNEIISKYGTTITFIARSTKLSKTTISRFIKGERSLKTEATIERIENFIKDRV